MFNSEQKLKILAVGAHGDDIELACGGTLAKALEHNHEVEMVLVTGNSSSDHNDVTIRADGIAEQEAKAAAKVLGVSKLHILGYQDTCVPYSAELVAKLDEIIGELKPDIIFTHFVFDTHQDHIRTAHSTISAARRQNTIFLYEPINPSGQGYVPFRPQVYVDITQTIDKKVNSLKAHQSQYDKYTDKWIDAVVARAQFRGFEMGTDYAECFEVVRSELKL
ncbi:PIG-L family deacetylase [Candidatus Woesearchaeota archaeon]|jgi:LmbE family N-acetylglucosaminyl deacetylase|nr:PIG-L family deacetylase [bacterium]MBT7558668.1 PIG-L family deacetylase [Candidatus Woesearchaeota archaeon]